MGRQVITPVKSQTNIVSRIVALIIFGIGIFAIIGLIYLVTQTKQEEVSIIRLAKTLNSGDVVTASSIEEYRMLRETYESLGTVNRNGKSVQTMILWANRDDVIGKYMTNYTKSGNYLSVEDLTAEVTMRNPWISEMSADEEVYTMAFSAGDINPRLLYPGTSLRVRLVMQVEASRADEVRKKIEEAEQTSANLSASLVRNSTVLSEGTNVSSTLEEDAKVAVAEIVIDRLVVTDMLNSTGESVYDIYMALLKIPVDQRIPYLSTELGDADIASSFQARVQPASLVFVLDKASASLMAEFESSSNAALKYTILPDLSADSLMMQFVEISNQLNTELVISSGG